MTWSNQPMCDACWEETNPTRAPAKLREPEKERCAWCGRETYSGIYVRARSEAVPYPS